jgi:hypothetical protein
MTMGPKSRRMPPNPNPATLHTGSSCRNTFTTLSLNDIPTLPILQVLFYTRMLSDIVGRMLPRRKALAITNPAALLALAGGLLVASGTFFGYLQVCAALLTIRLVMMLGVQALTLMANSLC